MREKIFDTYLSDIVNKKQEQPKEKADETAEQNEELSKKPAAEEDIGDFAEKTIRFSGESGLGSLYINEPQQEEPAPAPKKKKKKIRKANYSAYGGIVLSTLVLCTSIIISLFVIVVGRDFLGIDTNNNESTIYIENGWTMPEIANCLYENGIIEYPKLFVQFSKFAIGSDSVYPGDLDVKPSMSYSELIGSLTEMREAHETVTVTFIEGTTIDDAAKLLEENDLCTADEFVFEFNTSIFGFDFESYVSSSSLKYYKYEGYLFPDTYEFYVGDSVNNIVKKIKTRTEEILNKDVIDRCNELGYTLDQIVTLASILQLESGRAEDMAEIAGVFYNRLNNPSEFPRLQTDTTTRYINNVIKNDSAVAFQEMYDAYDTYVCNGLPVGPICNPGADAIHAALYPRANSYYYFCSDVETGEFYYAETYAEHMENAERAGLEV